MARLPTPAAVEAAELPVPSPVVAEEVESAPAAEVKVKKKQLKVKNLPVDMVESKPEVKKKKKVQPKPGETIKVIAKAEGFFDCVRIRPGDVFEISSMEQFSERWMELV